MSDRYDDEPKEPPDHGAWTGDAAITSTANAIIVLAILIGLLVGPGGVSIS